MTPPSPFRLVYRSCARIDWDPRKNDEVFAKRGFDLGYVGSMFPGFVLEREDTRGYTERRFQVIGEVRGEVFVLVYVRRRDVCRLITAWLAEREDWELWHDLAR